MYSSISPNYSHPTHTHLLTLPAAPQGASDVTMNRHEAGGRGLPLSPHLDPGPPSPDQAQFKPKRKLMTKFFNEPVDALDLRLANAEENLSTLPVDPFTDIKQEVGG